MFASSLRRGAPQKLGLSLMPAQVHDYMSNKLSCLSIIVIFHASTFEPSYPVLRLRGNWASAPSIIIRHIFNFFMQATEYT